MIWKTEGPTDLLALLSVDPDAEAFTTANGSKEIPADWILKGCEGKVVYVVHDADKPGQEGATWVGEPDGRQRPGWCPELAKYAKEVRNVKLPFEIEATNGQDLRDLLANQGGIEQLIEAAERAEKFGAEAAQKASDWIDEAEDDPQRLARINLKAYEDEHCGKLVYWRDEWWKWKAGKYRRIEGSELRAKVWLSVRKEFERCWKIRIKTGDDKPVRKVTKALVGNVVGAMESICCIPSSVPMPCWMPDRSQPHYVSTLNGILDLDAVFGKRPVEEWMIKHSHEWFSAFRLDYPFDPNADCPKWIEYLTYCMDDDAERISILQEWAGYLLTGSNDLQKFLVLEGEGGNGKTVFFSGMTAMLGEDNVSHVSIENFGGRFELGTTIGKSANISGDAGEIDGIAEGVLKQFTGGDIMQFDRKNLAPISARPTAKLMAAWNGRPRIKDKSMGLWRRMLLVPFNKKIEDHRKVLGMDTPGWWLKQGEAPGILLWAIAGLYRLRQQGGFTRSIAADAAVHEYREESNPAMRFFNEHVMFLSPEILAEEMKKDLADQRGVKADDLYLRYKEWCREESITPLAKQNFGKQIMRQFGDLKHRRGTRGNRYFVYRLLTTEEGF
jgi:P4 family phage/plasmid primase-like protien